MLCPGRAAVSAAKDAMEERQEIHAEGQVVQGTPEFLTDGWADESYLFDVDFESLSPEDQAFVWFTLPPREEAY